MDSTRYVVGVAALGVVIVSLAAASRTIRRRFMPGLDGPPGVLAEIVIALSVVIVTAELLGTIGLFAPVPVVAVSVGIGVVAVYTQRRAPRDRDAAPRMTVAEPEKIAWSRYAAMVAVAVAAASWSTRTIDSLHRGMIATTDTLWYHLPYAARFAQTGFTSHLHYPDGGSYTAFFPASSELLHGLGILLLGNDVLSPLLNLGWLALALFAAWCLGRPFGVGCVALVGVTFVLTTPQLILDDAGSGLNDVASVALLLASVALLVNAMPPNANERMHSQTVVCAALAAGLALGTKYTVIAPVGLLTLGVVVPAIRRGRAVLAVQWTGALLVTGGYWYLRNALRVGNPIPTLALGLGPLDLNHIRVAGPYPVANVVLDRHAWTAFLLPGLSGALGRAWWAVLALAFIGCVLGVLRGPGSTARTIAATAIVSFIAYLYIPQNLGLPHQPFLFVTNVRYCAPTLVLGAALLPIAATSLGARLLSVVLAAFVVTLLATQISPTVWAHAASGYAGKTEGSFPAVAGVVLGIVVLVAGIVWHASQSRLTNRQRRRLPVVVAVAGIVVGGFVLDSYYLDHRYENVAGMTNIYRWARNVNDSRIAFVGTALQYPLAGKDSSNYVQYVAQRHADGTSTPITRCADWRRALNEGKYKFVVVTTPSFPLLSKLPAPQVSWTEQDGAASLLIHESIATPSNAAKAEAWLYKISDRMNPDACGPQE